MSDPDNLAPEDRIKELEQQLEQMRLKADFYEAMVGVLKKDFGISIAKDRPCNPSHHRRSKE